MTALIVGLKVMLYCLPGGIAMAILWKKTGIEPIAFFGAVLWPIALPLLAGYWLGLKLIGKTKKVSKSY